MVDRAQFEDALRNEVSPVRRLVIAAGLIARAGADAGVEPLIVSGGTAVALVTRQDFGTRDIDIITPRGDELGVVLESIGRRATLVVCLRCSSSMRSALLSARVPHA